MPKCNHVGHLEVLAGSPNHYFVCLSKGGEIYPQIFICPHGLYFWDGFCRSEPKKEEKKEEAVLDAKISSLLTTEAVPESSSVVATSSSSTFRVTEYPPDTFLADKFDLNNYETIDDSPFVPHASYEFSSSSLEQF